MEQVNIGTITPFTIARIRARLHDRLDPKRYCHVMGVETFALAIADAAGASREKAVAAALLHDYCKNETREQLTAALKDARRFVPTEEDWAHPAVWHGLVAAELAPSLFDIDDHEVLEAVAFHSTGEAKVGPIALALFVADFIEPSRNFKGVEAIRHELLTAPLIEGARRVAQMKLEHVRKKGKVVHSRTQSMNDWLSQIA